MGVYQSALRRIYLLEVRVILRVELTEAQARALLDLLSEGAEGLSEVRPEHEWETYQRALDKVEPLLARIAKV